MVLNFTATRYTLLFLYSKIYIVHVINCEWSIGKSGFASHTKHIAEATNMDLFYSWLITCIMWFSKFENKIAYLGAVKFKTKDQKYLRTLLIFTPILLTPKKCGLLISSRENKRISHTHIQIISFSYKILYVFLLIIDYLIGLTF